MGRVFSRSGLAGESARTHPFIFRSNAHHIAPIKRFITPVQ
jgi:hypothetical protein